MSTFVDTSNERREAGLLFFQHWCSVTLRSCYQDLGKFYKEKKIIIVRHT